MIISVLKVSKTADFFGVTRGWLGFLNYQTLCFIGQAQHRLAVDQSRCAPNPMFYWTSLTSACGKSGPMCTNLCLSIGQTRHRLGFKQKNFCRSWPRRPAESRFESCQRSESRVELRLEQTSRPKWLLGCLAAARLDTNNSLESNKSRPKWLLGCSAARVY